MHREPAVADRAVVRDVWQFVTCRLFMRANWLPAIIPELARDQISVRSDRVDVSSMLAPRYRTVFSMLVCPNSS